MNLFLWLFAGNSGIGIMIVCLTPPHLPKLQVKNCIVGINLSAFCHCTFKTPFLVKCSTTSEDIDGETNIFM